jgi:hypothetical protein
MMWTFDPPDATVVPQIEVMDLSEVDSMVPENDVIVAQVGLNQLSSSQFCLALLLSFTT